MRPAALSLRVPGRLRARSRTSSRRCSHARRRAVALAIAGALAAGGGWLWLRDSPLVAVDEVMVSGLTGADAGAIRSALTDAARDMTTLHVRMDRLRTAVSPYPIVKDVRVETDFPHGMRVIVVEHDAVAAVEIDGRRVPVAADGTLLRGRAAGGGLVTLSVPGANGGGRLTSRRGRTAVAIMGAAPRALRPYVADVALGPDGLRVVMRNGPLLQFGDVGRARAKWLAAARVLGDPRAAGASYIDLRAPERPVAGRFEDPAAASVLDGTVPAPTDASGDEEAASGQTASPGGDDAAAASGETAGGSGSGASGEASTEAQAAVEGQ